MMSPLQASKEGQILINCALIGDYVGRLSSDQQTINLVVLEQDMPHDFKLNRISEESPGPLYPAHFYLRYLQTGVELALYPIRQDLPQKLSSH